MNTRLLTRIGLISLAGLLTLRLKVNVYPTATTEHVRTRTGATTTGSNKSHWKCYHSPTHDKRVHEFQRFDRFALIDYSLNRELFTKFLEVSHGFLRSSASVSTTHEPSHSVQCLDPRKRSPYLAIRHMPDTPCARPYALVHDHADCDFWDLTHHSRLIRAVFVNNESGTRVSTKSRGYDNFSHLCASLSLEVPTISAVPSFPDRPFSGL